MKLTGLDSLQIVSVLKAAFYVCLSAGLDFLISQTAGTQFGTLTPLINVVLVLVKKAFTEPEG